MKGAASPCHFNTPCFFLNNSQASSSVSASCSLVKNPLPRLHRYFRFGLNVSPSMISEPDSGGVRGMTCASPSVATVGRDGSDIARLLLTLQLQNNGRVLAGRNPVGPGELLPGVVNRYGRGDFLLQSQRWQLDDVRAGLANLGCRRRRGVQGVDRGRTHATQWRDHLANLVLGTGAFSFQQRPP